MVLCSPYDMRCPNVVRCVTMGCTWCAITGNRPVLKIPDCPQRSGNWCTNALVRSKYLFGSVQTASLPACSPGASVVLEKYPHLSNTNLILPQAWPFSEQVFLPNKANINRLAPRPFNPPVSIQTKVSHNTYSPTLFLCCFLVALEQRVHEFPQASVYGGT